MTRRLVAGAMALCLLMLSGCMWGQPGFDGASTGYNPIEGRITSQNVASLTQAWSAPVAGDPGQTVTMSDSGMIHVADATGAYGLDRATGEQRWVTPLAGRGAPLSTLSTVNAGGGGDVLVPTFDDATKANGLERLDAATGAPVGRVELGAQVLNMNGQRRQVIASARSGDWVASSVIAMVTGLGDFGFSTFIRVSNLAEPARSWTVTPPSYLTALFTPVVIRNRVYAVNSRIQDPLLPPRWSNIDLLGWDIDTPCGSPCAPDVSVPLPAGLLPSELAGSPDARFAALTSGQQVHVIDLVAGQVAWRGDIGASSDFVPTWTPDGLLVRGTGRLAAFPVGGCGAATCAPLWTTSLPDSGPTRMAAAADVVFLGVGTQLVAYPTSCTTGCAPAWSVDLGSRVTHPIVSDGMVITVTADRRVVAFSLPR